MSDTYTRECAKCGIETDCMQYDEPDSIPGEINLIWLCEDCANKD